MNNRVYMLGEWKGREQSCIDQYANTDYSIHCLVLLLISLP